MTVTSGRRERASRPLRRPRPTRERVTRVGRHRPAPGEALPAAGSRRPKRCVPLESDDPPRTSTCSTSEVLPRSRPGHKEKSAASEQDRRESFCLEYGVGAPLLFLSGCEKQK